MNTFLQDNSVSVIHPPTSGDPVLPHNGQQSGIVEHTVQSIQHNGHSADNYVHKNSAGRKKYSDFYGFADDDDGTFV